MSIEELHNIETEIDEAFAQNELVSLPFAQCAWTLLSVVEDIHFRNAVVFPLDASQAAIHVDNLLNEMTYPLRVCYQRAVKGPFDFNRTLIDEHYKLAYDWLKIAEDYTNFCTIFPMFHAKEIGIVVQGNELIPTNWLTDDLSYEVYDRFVAKYDPTLEIGLDPNLIQRELMANIHASGGYYSVNFTGRLMKRISLAFDGPLRKRHTLPDNWQFAYFSLAQFRSVFICLQSMAYTWFVARQIAAADGAAAIAFSSAVWTPKKGVLLITIARHTGLPKLVVQNVLRYLTFGEVGVRNPDIAIQPIIDLTNGQYAISPFVMKHVHAERNLCVLLNQVDEDRKLYSQLVDEKENQARQETIASLNGLGLDFKYGPLDDTDLDLAIIDRKAKICLCIEIKWFIQPAEVREVLNRTEDLRKGVSQAQKIAKMFSDSNARLMSLLQIDQSYDFQAMVGSANFIGRHGVQHPDIPITKLWHLASKIQEFQNLAQVMDWLRSRSYLPSKNKDYKITEIAIQSGKWKSRWYGIAHS